MERLQVLFFRKASVLQSKAAFMGCFLSLLPILLLAFLQLESTFLPTVWHALPGLLEEPALAFLLLNCVTLTIIASSKLGSQEGGYELEERKGEVAMTVMKNLGGEERRDVIETVMGLSLYTDRPVENGHQKKQDLADSALKPALYVHAPFKTCRDSCKSKNGSFLRKSWSLDANFENKTKHEPIKLNHVKESVKEKKLRSRGRLGSRKNEKAGLHPNQPSKTELLKKQFTRGSSTSSNSVDKTHTHDQVGVKPVLTEEKCNKAVEEQCIQECSGSAGNVADQGLQQAEDSAPAAAEPAHPSMDEVWATIISANRSDDRMASCLQVRRKRSRKKDSKAVKQRHSAVAPTCTATFVAPPGTVTAAITLPRSAGKLIHTAAKIRPPTAAAEKPVVAENGSTELEELRRRADEFIHRFNRQMRLQREESLQAQRQMCISV